MILSLILRFNLRLGGYSIWSASSRKYLEDYSMKLFEDSERSSEHPKHSKTPSEVLDACRTRLRRARGLVRPGTAGLPTGAECSRVGKSTWICPTSFVSTRIGVELVDILGN